MKRSGDTLYFLSLHLLDIEPQIWRRIVVPGSVTLWKLHHIFQVDALSTRFAHRSLVSCMRHLKFLQRAMRTGKGVTPSGKDDRKVKFLELFGFSVLLMSG